MKALPCLLFCSVLALSACKDKIENDTTLPAADPAAAATADDAGQAPARADNDRPRVTTPERIAAIEAEGRTGLWADVDATCGTGPRENRVTTLTWNVTESGSERVVLYVVSEDGNERNFGTGGPVGEKETGPWLRPDITFRLRDRETKEQIDELVIPAAADCPAA